MNKMILAAALAAGLQSGSAFAADVDNSAPYDWSGFYAGAYAAYVYGDADFGVPMAASSGTIDGFRLGGLGGYNRQFGENIVFGVEGDLGFLAVDRASGAIDDFDIEPEGRVRLRAGWANDIFLPFLAGGLSLADADITIPGTRNDSNLHWGFNAGAGVDVALTENIVGRAEYVYDSYFSETYSYPGLGATFPTDWDSHTIRAGVTYKFDW